jgi:DNA invertase Pin-like site-specific DNA recombinase
VNNIRPTDRKYNMEKIVALVRVSTDKQDVNNQKFAIEKKYPGYDIVW